MPDTAVLSPITIVRPDLSGRRPALKGFIIRRLFAANVRTARQAIIEACKAELAWSVAHYTRLYGHVSHDARYDGPHPAESYRLPHEHAAARVLNAWGHLHPTEWRVRENLKVLRSQIEAAAMMPSWGPRADATRDTLRLLLADRARQAKAFFAAVERYRRLRAELEDPTDGAPCMRRAA